jgi:hypothetical protein
MRENLPIRPYKKNRHSTGYIFTGLTENVLTPIMLCLSVFRRHGVAVAINFLSLFCLKFTMFFVDILLIMTYDSNGKENLWDEDILHP